MRITLVSTYATLASLALALLSACGHGERVAAGVPDKIDFNWDVRPILSDNCFRCHGPDVKGRKAGLRLDLPETAYGELPESPGKHAIVPGSPDQSELVRRITSSDPDVRMPPAASHKSLAPQQVALLKAWIEDGAKYKPHWAFIAPQKARVPQSRFEKQAINDVDRFVLARLEHDGLVPSTEADRDALINRVSLTLTGLPPTLEEVEAFVRDTGPNAYEKVVDRLLASPAYAERMASVWMNLARWAETDGYLDDHHTRFLWPWRDWVIDAFQKNMPYDQFATTQIAGDLLPHRTREQLLATAFLRLGKRSAENGSIDEEFRIEYVVDRTDAMGTAFLGLTVGCARCHDHKYDPISQKDYYSLSGFFNSADEPGVYAPGHSGIQGGPTLPWLSKEKQLLITQAEQTLRERSGAYDSALASATREASSKVAALLHDGLSEKPRAVLTKVTAPRGSDVAGLVRSSLDAAMVAYYPFDNTIAIPDSALPSTKRPPADPPSTDIVEWRKESMFRNFAPPAATPPAGKPKKPTGPPIGAFGPPVPSMYAREQMRFSPAGMVGVPPAVIQEPTLAAGVKGQALFFNTTNKGYFGRDVGYYDRTQEFSFDLWFQPAEAYEDSVPVLSHRDDLNTGAAGYQLDLVKQRLVFTMAHSRPYNMLTISVTEPLPLKQWTHITLTYDGSSRAAGLHLYLNGRLAPVEVLKDNLTQSALPVGYGFPIEDLVGLSFGTRFREKAPVGSGLDEFRAFNRALTPLEVQFLHEGERALQADAGGLDDALAQILATHDAKVQQARHALDEARSEQNRLVTSVPQVLVMADTATPRPTYRLDRGVYSEKREEVPVRALTQIFPWDAQLPANRIGLARWLFDRKNPLTARVFVNRIWQMHFGTGLVKTAEDFGAQGSIPSNPELLDWLAVGFMESGWDIKRLHKLIVMSATYRQRSEASEDLLKRDPENILLARGVRMRMPAEMVRDNALVASGLLARTVGGPSVHPYQPDNIWDPLITFYQYPDADKISPDEHHRRSLYTFIKRNAMHPGMQLFDAADPNVSIARRRVSNTPLQSLLLLNDPQYEEAYRALATRALKARAQTPEQLMLMFQLARRQHPTPEQLGILSSYYNAERQHYAADPGTAQQVLKVGVMPVDAQADPINLAALTDVAALIMNSPDAYSIR